MRPRQEKKYHLTPAQVAEIRKLRAEDPQVWTRVRLAEKFECSQFFVSLCCSSPEIKEQRDKELEEIKRKWGRKKTEARGTGRRGRRFGGETLELGRELEFYILYNTINTIKSDRRPRDGI